MAYDEFGEEMSEHGGSESDGGGLLTPPSATKKMAHRTPLEAAYSLAEVKAVLF